MWQCSVEEIILKSAIGIRFLEYFLVLKRESGLDEFVF